MEILDRVWIGIGCGASLFFPRPALAFDYVEHAHISHHALTLVTTECNGSASASYELASKLADALRVQLDTPLLSKDAVDEDQPDGHFTLSDIPALAGDHAASPLLTRWRWLDPTLPSHSQGVLFTAVPAVIALLNTSSRSPETERLHVPDREGFLGFIRGLSPSHWPLGVGPSDIDLERYDSNYIGLAERGHPHFRPRLADPAKRIPSLPEGRLEYIAALRYLTSYPQWDSCKKCRSKPDNNAFAWYADQHLGALRMAHAAKGVADDDRALLLATALFLELNAWHYLEDSVAAGHMIGDANSPHDALNNGALSATHNEYCAGAGLDGNEPPRRVDALVPPELCTVVKDHNWESQLPQLAAVCAKPTEKLKTYLQTIYGDHVIAESGVVSGSLVIPARTDQRSFDALVTENWAAALAAESFDEVVRAAKGEDFGLPVVDPLAKCGWKESWTKNPAYTWGHVPSEVKLYECLYAWWEGDEKNEHGGTIAKLLTGPAFRALRLVPVPEPDDSKRYPEQTFYSGNSLSLAIFGYGYSHSLSSVQAQGRAGLGAAYEIVAPRTLLPIQISVGGMFETGFQGSPQPRLGGRLEVRYDYRRYSKWYFGASGEVGYVFEADQWDGGGDVIPLGWTWGDWNSLMFNAELRGGYDAFFGSRLGASVNMAF